MANAPKILTPRQMVEKYGNPHLFKIQGRDGTLAWEAQAGMQERLFQLSETGPPETQADEILIGGIRGPGKSAGLLAWLSVPVWNPKYVGLLVRYSAEAMKETIEEAWDLYRKMGARKRARPTEFHFPSEWAGGAIIYTGHFKDERSLEDVRGHQYQRIGIEELCQIPSFSMYTQLAGANRTTIEGLPAKVCSTANPDGPGNCVPYGDVLTPGGWKPIESFVVGDPVYTVLADGSLQETTVDQVHQSWHDGDICSVNMRGFHLACTPNHRVAKLRGTRDNKHGLFSLVQFKELPGQAQILRTVKWQGSRPSNFILPAKFEKTQKRTPTVKQPDGMDSRTFFSFMGWFLSEGNTNVRDKGFGISQKKPDGKVKLQAVLDAAGFHGGWHGGISFVVYSEKWWQYLRQFGKAGDKHVPTWMKNADREHLKLLFEALMDGDGHMQSSETSGSYYTVSKRLADDVSEIAVKLGYHVTGMNRIRQLSTNTQYCVYFKETGGPAIEFQTGNHVYDVKTCVKRKLAVVKEKYSGPVYCIGIEGTHSFVIRQKCSVWVSGNSWVKKHFIDVYSGGTKIEPGTPFIDPVTKRVRVFIRGVVGENFALHSKDPGYYDRLRMNPPHIVKAWIDGDWDASASQVFEEWRPNGPLPADPPEPAWARHVIASRPVVPWAHRWASCDWGYSHHAACHWAAIGEDKRIHVTDELVARKHEPDRLGAEWAKVTAPMLEGMEPEHHITLYFSHEAFRNKTTSERTIGDMFMLGVERILGPGSVFMMRHTDEEKQLKTKNPEAALELLLARRRTLGKRLRVTIRVNNPDRVAGLAYAHTLFRWKVLEDPPKADMDYAYALLQEPNGHLKFEKYMRLFDAVTPEVLPGVVIHDRCKELIECIPKLQPDPDRLEDNLKFHGDMMAVGDDPWESFRSLCMGFKDVENRKPARVLFAETVQKFVKSGDDFNTVVQVGRFTAAKQAHERKQLQGDLFLEYACIDEIRNDSDIYSEPG